jgi:hypothetical protein
MGGKMLPKDVDKAQFHSVALVLIVLGAGVFAYGIVTWLFNYLTGTTFNIPSEKFMGGLIILGIGYVVLEIEFLRR